MTEGWPEFKRCFNRARACRRFYALPLALIGHSYTIMQIMKSNVVHKLLSRLEELVHREGSTGTEFWLARDLQSVLGYSRWSNFTRVIERAMTACEVGGLQSGRSFFAGRQIADGGPGCREASIEPRSRRLRPDALCLLPDCSERQLGEGPGGVRADVLCPANAPPGDDRTAAGRQSSGSTPAASSASRKKCFPA